MMISQSLIVLGLMVQGFTGRVDGSTPLLARPPLGTRAAFVLNEPIIAGSVEIAVPSTHSPSFVSVGIRSSCARERASTPRNRDEAGASAAARLRGGSWGPGHTPFMPQLLHAADKPKEQPPRKAPLDSCSDSEHRRQNGAGAQLTASKQRVLEDPEPAGSYEEEDEGGRVGGGGGGGGGGRAGGLPSFPRTLPAGKAPSGKKFAWVP